MAAVGDRVRVYEGEDGQLYAVLCAKPTIGARVIVTEGEDGQLYATLCGSGAIGDRVQVIEGDLGIPLAMVPSGGVASSLPYTLPVYPSRSVKYTGERVLLGPFSFTWDGSGSVFISGSSSSAVDITCDDGFDVESDYGLLEFRIIYPEHHIRNGADITSICRPGSNAITITVVDVYGSGISFGAYPGMPAGAYIVRV